MILKKAKTVCLPLVCCMALALVFFQAPAKCYGDEDCSIIEIDVAPTYQVNIDRVRALRSRTHGCAVFQYGTSRLSMLMIVAFPIDSDYTRTQPVTVLKSTTGKNLN